MTPPSPAPAPAEHDLQSLGPFQDHSPDQHRPLGSYGLLMGAYLAAAGGFATWYARSGRELPERVDWADLALTMTATHKLTRMLAKERITSVVRAPFTTYKGDSGHAEVDEAARGRGLQRALGELAVCPYCMAVWTTSGFAAGLLVAPRATRQVAGILTGVLGSDVLQMGYHKLEEAC